MKKYFMQFFIFALAVLGLSSSGFAQMYGTGMGAVQQSCPYGAQMGDEAQSIQDDISEQADRLKELQAKLREAKSDKKELERKMTSAKGQIERRGIQADFLAKIIDHITEMRACSEYEGSINPGGNRVRSQSADGRNPASEDAPVRENDSVSVTTVGNGKIGTEPYNNSEWNKICDYQNKGRIRDGACSQEIVGRTLVSRAVFNVELCKSNLKAYQDAQDKVRRQDAVIASLEAEVESTRASLADMRGALKEAIRDYQKEQREQMTEGGCVDCMLQGSGYVYQKPKTDWGGVVTNLGLGIASIYLGNDLQKYVANQNARIGAQTTGAYPSFGYGYPFIMGAIGAATGGGGGFYGAVGGGVGSGAFGCGNGMYGNGYGNLVGGAMGYPSGMLGSPYGGGIYSGMPMGMMGGGYGMMNGMMMGGGMGMMSPYGMMSGGGMMSPYGMMAGGGMPMGMMMNGGLGMMSGGGMMSPYGMMAGGGMPMGMMMNGGLGMMSGGGMMSPYGMMAGGGMPMGMMMNGGMGMMAGGGMMMGMDSSAMMQAQMQMQQQMMQMQMQQQQAYMQAYQQAQANYMNKQQVLMGLQQELQGLIMRINQVQYSTSTGGYLNVGGFYGGSTISNSPFGNTNYNSGSPFGNPGTTTPTVNGTPSTR